MDFIFIVIIIIVYYSLSATQAKAPVMSKTLFQWNKKTKKKINFA